MSVNVDTSIIIHHALNTIKHFPASTQWMYKITNIANLLPKSCNHAVDNRIFKITFTILCFHQIPAKNTLSTLFQPTFHWHTVVQLTLWEEQSCALYAPPPPQSSDEPFSAILNASIHINRDVIRQILRSILCFP